MLAVDVVAVHLSAVVLGLRVIARETFGAGKINLLKKNERKIVRENEPHTTQRPSSSIIYARKVAENVSIVVCTPPN